MFGLRPPFVHFGATSLLPHCVGPSALGHPPPQGSSLLSELCCLGPSSLNRPHPPHPRAHRDFIAWRLIRNAFAVRGAPRRPAGGSGLSLSIPSWHAVLSDPGEFDHRCGPELRYRRGLRRDLNGSALPILPQSVSRGARISGLPGLHICYGLSGCSPSCTDQTDLLGHRGLLLPGFQRLGLPCRCWI